MVVVEVNNTARNRSLLALSGQQEIETEMIETYQPEEMNDVEFMYATAHGPGIIASKKPVRTTEDIKGMKIRATGLSAKIVEAQGVSANSVLRVGGTIYNEWKNENPDKPDNQGPEHRLLCGVGFFERSGNRQL